MVTPRGFADPPQPRGLLSSGGICPAPQAPGLEAVSGPTAAISPILCGGVAVEYASLSGNGLPQNRITGVQLSGGKIVRVRELVSDPGTPDR